MKKRSFFVFVLAMTLLIPSYLISFQAAAIVNPNSSQKLNAKSTTSTFSAGVNYLSLYYQYSPKYLNDTILNRDFSQFKRDGIKVISLCLTWYGVEPSRGIYDNGFLANVKHIITVADQHGIKVMVDFHTLWSYADSYWCTPAYAMDPVTGKNDGLAIVRNDSVRQGFIAMVTHSVKYLAGTSGIWAWALLNEPWYWGRNLTEHDFVTLNGQTQRENFITLIQNLSSTVKTFDKRPVTVRFVDANIGSNSINNIFTSDWNWDQRIFNALNFISFNAYLPTNPALIAQWQNITTQNVMGSAQRGKQVWVTETGSSSGSDSAQTQAIQAEVSFFKTLPVQGWIAWFWEGDLAPKGYNQIPGDFGKGYNLCASANGTARTAYYQLKP